MKKTIITVQHTESEHHLNGHAGAWGNWQLTENGRNQAFEIGKWLLDEGCADGFVMYTSDLARAFQTAEEINKALHLTPVISELIREVNAGAGNGKPWDWFD
jgi:probable phosphoglycerate mutase